MAATGRPYDLSSCLFFCFYVEISFTRRFAFYIYMFPGMGCFNIPFFRCNTLRCASECKVIYISLSLCSALFTALAEPTSESHVQACMYAALGSKFSGGGSKLDSRSPSSSHSPAGSRGGNILKKLIGRRRGESAPSPPADGASSSLTVVSSVRSRSNSVNPEAKVSQYDCPCYLTMSS